MTLKVKLSIQINDLKKLMADQDAETKLLLRKLDAHEQREYSQSVVQQALIHCINQSDSDILGFLYSFFVDQHHECLSDSNDTELFQRLRLAISRFVATSCDDILARICRNISIVLKGLISLKINQEIMQVDPQFGARINYQTNGIMRKLYLLAYQFDMQSEPKFTKTQILPHSYSSVDYSRISIPYLTSAFNTTMAILDSSRPAFNPTVALLDSSRLNSFKQSFGRAIITGGKRDVGTQIDLILESKSAADLQINSVYTDSLKDIRIKQLTEAVQKFGKNI